MSAIAEKVSSSSVRRLALASVALGGVGAAVVPAQPAAAHEYTEFVVDAFGGTSGGVNAAHTWVGTCHQGSGAGHINYRLAGGGSGILESYGDNCVGRYTTARVTRFQVCDLRIGRCTGWKNP